MTSEPGKPSAPIDILEDDCFKTVSESLAHLDLQVSASSKQFTVYWGPIDPTKNFNWQIKIYIFECSTVNAVELSPEINEEHKTLNLSDAIVTGVRPFANLECGWRQHSPGQSYYVYIKVANDEQQVIACGGHRLRACYSKNELQKLYEMAVSYSGTTVHLIDEVYRCKPSHYWNDIFNDDGIMKPYLKDNNGHAANHINSALKGLFFSAELKRNGTKRDISYFGDRKYSVPPRELLDPDVVNFYFCDFYCNANNPTKHFVTIVICKKKSASDTFCTDRLIQLHRANPFFEICPRTGSCYVNQKVCVELFYTEDMALQRERLAYIQPRGFGSSSPGGLPNNKNCPTCNLFD